MLNASFTGGGEKFKYYALLDLQYDNAVSYTHLPVGNVNNVLGGQLSGVTTVQYSGEPGSDAASVFVRGKASLNR